MQEKKQYNDHPARISIALSFIPIAVIVYTILRSGSYILQPHNPLRLLGIAYDFTFGIPILLLGISTGIRGLKTEERNLSIVGIILNIVAPIVLFFV